MTNSEHTARIRRILKEHGRLSTDPETLAAEQDLYQAGMTSQARTPYHISTLRSCIPKLLSGGTCGNSGLGLSELMADTRNAPVFTC